MSEVQHSIKRTEMAGFGLVALLALGVFGWGAQAQIAGAVIARGQVSVKSNAKAVQHLEGGIVQRLFVNNGDHVEAGDLVIRLDDTDARANLSILETQLTELLVEQERLDAEREERDKLYVPQFLVDRIEEPAVQRVLRSQIKLLRTRLDAVAGLKQQLREQIAQLNNQIEGLQAQRQAKAQKAEILAGELKDLEGLQARGLVPKRRILDLSREQADLAGDAAQLAADVARLKGRITEIELKIIQVDEERRAEILKEMTAARTQIGRLQEQVTAARTRLNRIEIRAPQSGIVHELDVHTEGGVLGAGQPAMMIIPDNDELVVRAQVRPEDIDQIALGQTARIQFSAFSQRNTPDILGSVTTIGADLSIDETTRLPFYLVDIEVPPAELDKLEGRALKPGMPAQAFIRTNDRTALTYVLKPLSEQIGRAFRD